MTNIDRARRILESMTNRWGKPATARDAAQALADAGLLTPEPQIIRTRDELAALDPDTMLVSTVETQYAFTAEEPQEILAQGRKVGIGWLPAVVVATGEQARAARQALGDVE